jgi:hypothetical protein
MAPSDRYSIWKKYGFLWVTLVLFIGSMLGHWSFGWAAYKQEQLDHNAPVTAGAFATEMLRDTFENWQSEFLQLVWQVSGLAILWHVGSPQSKEGDDRKEEKLDLILAAVDPDAEQKIREIDRRHPRK